MPRSVLRWAIGLAVAASGIMFRSATAEPASEHSPITNGVGSGVNQTAESIGPDVIAGEIHQLQFYGSVAGGISALSIGTVACNIGDAPLSWYANTSQHPVIAQNMYRLYQGRFEQIGMSWLKHSFYAEQGSVCGPPTGCLPEASGERLGVGCSDPYSASLNGSPGILGPRSQVNAHTGQFPYPFTAPGSPPTVGRRLQVHLEDILPSLNPGAIYFVEGQYVTSDDAAAGNQNNNASYRRVTIAGSIGNLVFGLAGATARQQAAIRVWKEHDSAVVETDVQIPGEGLILLAARATDLGDGLWNYEYAVQNLNSDRAIGSLSLPIDPVATVQNLGFHDVDYHSGEPYELTAWSASAANGRVGWSTRPYSLNPDANALRWGTLYNFRFQADRPPVPTTVRFGLFKPGPLTFVEAATIGPAHPPPDCDGNGIDDPCDLGCGVAGGVCDVPGCGTSVDQDGNAVPDQCDPDCNANDVPDALDIHPGQSEDCNGNTVPDECEGDADGDGVINDCDACPFDALNDADGDGFCVPQDGCPEDPLKFAPGQCGCGYPDDDGDSDGVMDCLDNCPQRYNPTQSDVDGDGDGDPCDNCPVDTNPDQLNVDGDAMGDQCDPCPLDALNDSDGDGVCAPLDQCPFDRLKVSPQACGCQVPDVDSDGDGAPDCIDACPYDEHKTSTGECGCGVQDVDTDGDEVADCHDQCMGLDDRIDVDGDGLADCAENVPAISHWGLVILTLLLLSGTKIAFGERPWRAVR